MHVEDEDPTEEQTLVRFEIPLKKAIPKILYEAQSCPEAKMPDAELIRIALPDSLDWRLRIRYNSLVQKFYDPSNITNIIRGEDIFKGICSYEVYRRRVDIPAKAVFITRRLGSYLEDQDALITAMGSRLWEIASARITNEDGTVDLKAAQILHKTINILLDRKYGQAVQRHAHAMIAPPAGSEVPHSMDPVMLEAQIKHLEELDAGR